MSDARLATLAAKQHGLITRQQALAAGLSAKAIRHRLATGRWVEMRSGVYAVAGAPATQHQAVHAAVLAAGEGAVASHLTAAQLWGLALPPPERIHVLTPMRGPVRLEGVQHHRSTSLDTHDLVRRHGIPVTSPARTLVDASGGVPLDRLEEAVDDAERRELLRIGDLTSCIDRVATGPGRRPTVSIRTVASERLPVGDSPAEKNLLRGLLRRHVPMPVLGHVVVVRGREYRLDMSWPWSLLSLEYESWEFHGQFRAFHRGHERARRLRAARWDLWPVTSRTDLDELAEDILTRLCDPEVTREGPYGSQSA